MRRTQIDSKAERPAGVTNTGGQAERPTDGSTDGSYTTCERCNRRPAAEGKIWCSRCQKAHHRRHTGGGSSGRHASSNEWVKRQLRDMVGAMYAPAEIESVPQPYRDRLQEDFRDISSMEGSGSVKLGLWPR